MGRVIFEPFVERGYFDPSDTIAAIECRPKVVDPIHMPSLPSIALVFQWYAQTVSAVFATAWFAYCPRVVLPSLAVVHAVTNGGTADGEHQVKVTAGANIATSAVQAYASGSARYQSLGWTHQLPRWTDDILLVELQHRRTAGAGTIYTGRPVFVQIDPHGCTVAGAWYPGSPWLP